ncbi:uncharacterized protein SAPINGB_P002921 [Magnusiomyces paraingens]|uniref:UBC core domain-containing protein n=1 Tax=Magnusiomyces paraingens TaxID=2606893 RepID=A0A5E8BI88_9ASCO|nr:uncharacterized protein SAPINGB_P002921 [Saprochaete ingens]VVT50911.1 unnamed protein product [Saprochaete ingens]
MAQRIHKDLAKLFKAPPPDCILDTEDDDDDSSLADPEPSIGLALPGRSTGLGMSSLSTISFYLLGPESTAFYGGAWRVKLKIPSEYPRKAPAAYFVTKIFHPNVQPSTGEVCVDTLKRDWRPDVDLAQIILTIRCLLIQPNPESSLNEEAGKLMLDDYAAFERMARVMTKVHSIPRADILKKFNLDDSPLVEEPMKKIEAPNSTTTTTTTTTTASTVKPDMLPVKEDIEMVDGKGFQDSIIITNNNKENGGAGTTNSGLSSPLILSATCSTGQDLQMIQTQSSAQTSSVLLPRDERDTNNITNNSGINSSSPLFPASKESSFNGLCTSLTPPSSSSSSSSNSLTKAPPSPLSPTMGPAPAYSPTAGTSPTTVSSSSSSITNFTATASAPTTSAAVGFFTVVVVAVVAVNVAKFRGETIKPQFSVPVTL